MFKKLLLGLGITSLLAFAGLVTMNTANAQVTTQFWDVTSVWGVWVAWADDGVSSEGLIWVVKSFINWMLGILSLIALMVLLFGGFKMVTAAWDETKYKDGFKVLKQAWVGLAVIWVSWMVVSLIFFVLGSIGL